MICFITELALQFDIHFSAKAIFRCPTITCNILEVSTAMNSRKLEACVPHNTYSHPTFFHWFFLVVPRTFTGPILLATRCQLLRLIFLPLVDLAAHPMLVQFLARFFLLLINAHGWWRLASSLEERHKGIPFLGSWFLLITACQFHMPFYAS